jgi:predicted transcriptional regulator
MSSRPRDRVRSRHSHGPEESTRGPLVSRATDDVPVQLELLDDEYTREILAALGTGPQEGRELDDRCSASRATIYRRLNRLEEAGLVTTEMALDADGHHRKRFCLVRDRLTVAITDGAITVTAHPKTAER